jgi:flagellar assembly protein FliH
VPFAKLIAFDRPLAGATLPGQAGKSYTEAELATKLQAAFHAGVDSARAAADQQMVELRADLGALSDGVLKRLNEMEPVLLGQLREALPGLALEIARRLLAGFEPSAEIIERLGREALDQLYPERENLELSLCPRDGELVDRVNPEWKTRYPGLRVRIDPALSPGDSVVRSRFGLTDGRQQAKLAALEHALTTP